jgi:hypothetical protein
VKHTYAGIQSGCDPKMMDPCMIFVQHSVHNKTRIGYAAEAPGEIETPKARFVRELAEKRRARQ